jgi:hypothetical protein
MKASIKKTIQITAIVLISLQDESIERAVSFNVVDASDDVTNRIKARRKYSSVINMGGSVEVKRIES